MEMVNTAQSVEHEYDLIGSALDSSQYLTFRIADETYAFGILKVKEILRYETLTKVPSTPESVRGVINLRGSVVPVVDLAVKFKLPPSKVTKWTCVVIIEADLDGESTVMGIMADAVSQVVELKPKDIEPPPPFGTRVKVDYITGMAREGKKFLLILDIDKLLSMEELAAANLVEQDEEIEEEQAQAESTEEESDSEAETGREGVEKEGPAPEEEQEEE